VEQKPIPSLMTMVHERIASKVDSISMDAEVILMRNKSLAEVVDEILYKTINLLIKEDKTYRIDIIIHKDAEIPDWSEFVIFIRIFAKRFEEIFRIWKKIEEEAEDVMNRVKEEDIGKVLEIDRINRNLAIFVDEL